MPTTSQPLPATTTAGRLDAAAIPMKVTVCGPNLRDQSKGTFHVHAAGCADLARGARREPEYENGWTLEADSQDSVVLDVYGPDAGDFDFDPDSAEDRAIYRADFHFFPCTSALPTSAPEAATTS